MIFNLEEICLELRQIACPKQAGRVDEKWRKNFRVSVLARVHVEKKIDQGALQTGAGSPIYSEAGAGDLRGALQIEDMQIGPQIPVGLRFEIKLSGLAPAMDLDVVVRTASNRNRFVRNIRDSGQQRAE